MHLIVGLGNPGTKYEQTRHNTGFMVANALLSKIDSGVWIDDKRFEAQIAKTEINGEKIILAKPQTYMNESGRSVKEIAEYYDISTKDIIIISDDINIDVGKLRIRSGGSNGGHNGLKSVISSIGEDFWRVRVGVGANLNEPSEKYVLKNLTPEEKTRFKNIIDKVAKYLIDLNIGNISEESIDLLI